jgi:hypothetical protein
VYIAFALVTNPISRSIFLACFSARVASYFFNRFSSILIRLDSWGSGAGTGASIIGVGSGVTIGPNRECLRAARLGFAGAVSSPIDLPMSRAKSEIEFRSARQSEDVLAVTNVVPSAFL